MRAGTIVASNYVAMASVLAESFLAHHPTSTFTVLVVDAQPQMVDELVAVLPVGTDVATSDQLDLGPSVLSVMQTIYDVMEHSTAVKPAFMRLLLDTADKPVACYLDPDIEVFASFDDEVTPAYERGIVLTPHVLTPIPRDGLKVSEGTIMQSGMFNCGFLAVSERGRDFLNWWDIRLRFDADVDFEVSHFTDQRWVDWVPSLFDHHVCRNEAMNVGWWNIHERQIVLRENRPFVGDQPVRFVHFSGYDPRNPELLSKHQVPSPRVLHSPGSPMRVLADRYGERLIELGHLKRRDVAYGWSRSIDGVELTRDVRQIVRSALLNEVGEDVTDPRRTVPDGFGGGAETFGVWLSANRDSERVPDDGACVSVTAPKTRGRAPIVSDVRRIARRALGAGDRFISSRSRRSADYPSGIRPFALLHIPKSAGSSITVVLKEALPNHRWDEHSFDDSMLGAFRGVPLEEPLHSRVLIDPADLLNVEAAAGHLSLPTLRVRFAMDDIALVVREPRARLLSHYEYWRYLPTDRHNAHRPWTDGFSAVKADFEEWLVDPSVIHQTDNMVVRYLLAGDPDIPQTAEIPHERIGRLAARAVRLVRRLGWASILEAGDRLWASLSERIGVEVTSKEVNVTKVDLLRPVNVDSVLSERSTNLMAARTAGDALIWQEVARLTGVINPILSADVAWNRRLAATIRSVAG